MERKGVQIYAKAVSAKGVRALSRHLAGEGVIRTRELRAFPVN
jgi:hypothetical protein